MKFFIAMNPPTKTYQQKKVAIVKGKPKFYEPPELLAARCKLRDHLAGYVPDKMFNGTVRLVVKWCVHCTGNHKDGEYKYTKPDTDNLQKMLKDVMTELKFWKDDALVVSEIIEKFWAELPGLYIQIESFDK